MPAAAVIPAPIAYINVVAVKKLVVGFLVGAPGPDLTVCVLAAPFAILGESVLSIKLFGMGSSSFTVKKLECLKQAIAVNTLAWNNKIGPWCYFVGLHTEVMINRDSWGYSYLIVRGEILGFMKDELLRKHLPRMFSLIKNES